MTRDRRRARFSVSLFVATAIHVVAAFALPEKTRAFASRIPASLPTELIDIEPPTPALVPAAEPTPPVLAPAKVTAALARTERASAPAPAPAQPSQAGQVVTSSSDTDEALDFTTGSAPAYTGGPTATEGSAQRPHTGAPVAGTPARSGVPGSNTPSSALDGTQRATLAGELEWNCPFPSEADENGIDAGLATLRVNVSAEGRGIGTTVLHDPGHGFAAAARRCALTKRYSPARDRDGRPVTGTVVVQVRFFR
jgi:protein TonB